MPPSVIVEQTLDGVATLLQAAGLSGEFRLQPIPGGANNRVFRVEVAGTVALLKAYFQHPDDPRDRLGTEFAFAQFAWDHGARSGPKPLACDRSRGLGLYSFIEGRAVEPRDVTERLVHDALAFVHRLNDARHTAAAEALPAASEACFTIAEHLACASRRLALFEQMEPQSLRHDAAQRFIRRELTPAWDQVAGAVRQGAQRLRLDIEAPMAASHRRISPSDFGFHNALLTDEGTVRFIDFEYAGWDDPAKMVCDFFCQPALPVPRRYYDEVVETVVAELAEPDRCRQRMALLLPVHQVKWCCVLLNEFLPVGARRRQFAGDGATEEQRLMRQLARARDVLREVEETRRLATEGMR